jgi:gliding motility-associated-like protein
LISKNIILTSLVLILTFSVYGQVQLEPACAESVEEYGVDGYADSRFVWSFDHSYGQIINGEGTNRIMIHWGYRTGVIDMEVLEITSSECFNFPSQATIEIMAPDVDLGFDFPEICDQDTLVLSVGTGFEEPYEILWHDGSESNDYIAFSSEEIWVRVIDGFGCMRYDTVSLLVNPLPTVSLGEDTILCDNTNPLYIEPGNFAEYVWQRSSEEEETINSYLAVYPVSVLPDTIMLTITDFNGCNMSDTMVVYPCDIAGLFRDMPNTITPNGDGDNDVWNIPYIHFFDNAVLEIFDRWGRLVFRSANVYEEPWDGTSGGRNLPMDSYYYVLQLNMMNAEPVVGTVNLIR